jgi:hypothetical protein
MPFTVDGSRETASRGGLSLPPDPGDDNGFGRLLRRAREGRGLTLLDVSSRTKIPWRHLDALERGNFAALPGGFYRRSETSAYAEAVGLDQRLALTELERALAAAMPKPAEEPRRMNLSIGTWLWAGLGVLTLAALVTLAMRDRPDAAQAQGAGTAPAPQRTTPSSGLESAVGASPASAPATDDATPVNRYGVLTVETEPAGARVTVDGIGWGVTPVVIPNIAIGDKRVRITMDGYVPVERVVRLSENATARTVTILLSPVP